jgi:hypothetical protein
LTIPYLTFERVTFLDEVPQILECDGGIAGFASGNNQFFYHAHDPLQLVVIELKRLAFSRHITIPGHGNAPARPTNKERLWSFLAQVVLAKQVQMTMTEATMRFGCGLNNEFRHACVPP